MLFANAECHVTPIGMTVEVLGTVIGTGIQGQIVGMANAPCINSSMALLDADQNSSHPRPPSLTSLDLTHTVTDTRDCDAQSSALIFFSLILPRQNEI